MASQLSLTATTDNARTTVSQGALGTATTIAAKVRLNGAALLSAAAFNRRVVMEVGSLAGAFRAGIMYYHDPSPTPDEVVFDVRTGGDNLQGGYDRTAIVSGDFYVLYWQVGVGGKAFALATSAGSLLVEGADALDADLTNSNSANGKISVGQGVNQPVETAGIVGTVDGIAIYSAALALGARFSTPTASDTNLLTLVGFDEGTGSTAAAVGAGEDMTLNGSATWTGTGTWDGAAASSSAGAGGTLADGATEAEVRAGGQTCTITLTNDTWVASGATFNAQRQAIIDGFDSAGAGATGWNAEVRDNAPVTDVVRTSDTVVTVTFSAQAAYNISANETITVTVPAAAVVGNAEIVASPTFTITSGSDADLATVARGIRTGASFITSALRRVVSRYSG